tara:strand:- start:5455 stop:6915 length:1461 start_codon:yes stop_codon:yes gene_type:complete
MSSYKKTAVIITQNELINNWLELVISVVGEDCCFFVVQESNKLKKIQALFLKLNFKIFGNLKKDKINPNLRVNLIFKNELEDALRNHQTVLNFTSLETSMSKNINHLQFLISARSYCLYEVLFNTLTSYKKVELALQSNLNLLKTSSVRLDPFSVSKNTELVLASFLVLLKANNSCESEKRLKHKKTSSSIVGQDYFKYAFRFFKKLKHYFFYNEQWVLGYCFNPKEIGVDLKNDFKISPPKDRFWADPVVVEDKGKYYVFIEELLYKNKIAHLSVFELKEDGTYTEPEIILKKPYHLSYPFIFKEQGKYYMIPETAHNNDIQLCEAVSFPFKWEFKQKLIDNIKASDTTLLKKNNKWWLFTSIKRFEKGTYDNDLFVFYSDNLFSSNWTEHQENPILKDITSGRQGGGFFKIDNEDYRVSQNCESHYGYGFNLSKLQTLSESDFKEEKVYSFTPRNFKNVLGVHTYSHINSKLRVYDILTRTFKY